MKKSVKNERGLSPVLASVLMVLLILVLASIIFLWARGFISEQIEKFGTPIEDSCSLVSFEVNRLGNELEVINRGNIDIRHLDIKLLDSEGNSEMRRFDFSVGAGGESVVEYVTLTMTGEIEPEKIIVYPALVGNVKGKDLNKVFTCMNVGVKL